MGRPTSPSSTSCRCAPFPASSRSAQRTPTRWWRRGARSCSCGGDPAVLILSRQALPTLDRTRYAPAAGLARGAYVLADAPDGKPDVLLLGTGSEVSLCVAAYEQLEKEGVHARVVSMPCLELFERQPVEYRDA